MPTLRTTWEAKKQLVDLLVQSGIPEECMVPQVFNFTGPDPKLDMLVALIEMGTYPNVCMHKEKRKVLTTGEFIFHVIFEMPTYQRSQISAFIHNLPNLSLMHYTKN